MKNINYLRDVYAEVNETLFNNKLTTPTLLIKKTCTKEGYYSYRGDRHWKAMRRPEKAAIVVGEHCFTGDHSVVWGTLIHEMIHQYQVDVLGVVPHHDAVFKSIARQAKKVYKVEI